MGDHVITTEEFAELLKKIGFQDNDVCALADGQIDITTGVLTANSVITGNGKKQDTCYIVNLRTTEDQNAEQDNHQAASGDGIPTSQKDSNDTSNNNDAKGNKEKQ